MITTLIRGTFAIALAIAFGVMANAQTSLPTGGNTGPLSVPGAGKSVPNSPSSMQPAADRTPVSSPTPGGDMPARTPVSSPTPGGDNPAVTPVSSPTPGGDSPSGK